MSGAGQLRRVAGGSLRRGVSRLGFELVRPEPSPYPPDVAAIIERAAPYSMTPAARLHAVHASTRHIVDQDIGGAFVECGLWRGGSLMAAALTLIDAGATDRHLYGYDAFLGMPEPGDADLDRHGRPIREQWLKLRRPDGSSDWCRSDRAEVEATLRSTGYPPDRIHVVDGLVEDTLPDHAPDRIAWLRLDTDWYASTLHELEHLIPRMAPGGVLIIDDYGCWTGAQRAVDEYLGKHHPSLFLVPVDAEARLAVLPP